MKPSSPIAAFFRISRPFSYGERPFGPRVEIIHTYNPANTIRCPDCGHVIRLREGYEGAKGRAEVVTATIWEDNIGGFEPVISRKAMDEIVAVGATGFIARPLHIHRIESPHLGPPPPYCTIEITSRIDIDRQLYDGGDGLLCSTCGIWKPRPGGKVGYGDKLTVPLIDTWDGSDFVKCRNIRHGGYFCTPRIVELARVKGWTGFEFQAFVPKVPPVNLSNPDWFAEFEAAARAKYPQFF